MLRFLTAGESHGPSLTAILEGFPSGLAIDFDKLEKELKARQGGYGRNSRQKIESDKVTFTGGIRGGVTTGGPICMHIENKDFANWQEVMALEGKINTPKEKEVDCFRPGHADLAGTIKYGHKDIRDVIERASARETAARVAVGAICLQFLNALDINLASHVIQVGNVKAPSQADCDNLFEVCARANESEISCADQSKSEEMIELIKKTWGEGDSLGGAIEILVDNLPVGLGSYVHWDRRIDGQLAQALMSVHAIKAMEIGDGIEASQKPGSLVHDAINPAKTENLPFTRPTNRAGGVEGGMTNGSRLVIRAFMKPIPTLVKGLDSVSFPDFKAKKARYERSDVCAISACAVVAKNMTAFVLARALLEKFGQDSMNQLLSVYKNCNLSDA
ncbi:MAG: chorismate synthase [Candidatus Melainabacteria bacterium]|nr:chorismate synthase [Candidatus Melainabacteria bacterium]